MRRLRDAAATTLVAALLAFALRCAAAPVGWWWLVVPALCVAIAFAAGEGVSGGVAFRRGWLFGTMLVLGDLAWIIGPAGARIGPALYGIATALCALEALPIAIAAWAFARTDVKSPLGFCLGVPALYALLETARASGPLGLPLAVLGVTQTHGPFAVTLALGGIPLATFCAVATSATIVFAIRGIRESVLTPHTVRVAAFASGIAVFLLLAANLVWHGALAGRSTMRLAHAGLVEAGPVGVGRTFAATAHDYAAMTQRLPKDVDFAVWPEGVLYLIASDGDAQRAVARDAGRAFGRTILAGATLRAGGLLHNDLLAIDAHGTATSVYTKRRLVPFGEFQPFAIPGSNRPTYDSGSALEPPVRIANGTPFGALICFEIVFADLTRDSADAGGQYVIAVLNDSWFAGTDGPDQLAQVLTAGAIASGIAVIRVDTVPPSGLIDAGGDWIGEPLRGNGVAVVDVPSGIVTPYRRVGGLPALIAFVLIAGATLWQPMFRRRPQRRTPSPAPHRARVGSAKR